MSNQTSDNNKRIAKNTLLLYFRMLFMMLVSLYTSRVILRTLGVVDFGIYNVVGGVIAMLGFITGSLGAASSRYITYDLGVGNMSLMKKTFGNILTIHCVLAGFILFLGETIGLWFMETQLTIPDGRETAAFWVYQFSILSSIMAVITVPYNATIIAHEKMSAFAYISIVDVVLKLIIVYLLIIIPFDKLIIYSFLFFCIQVFDQFIYITYCNRKFEEVHTTLGYDKKLFGEIFAFAGWTMNGNLACVGYTQGLNILLNMFFGPVVNAARGIAVQVQNTCKQFCVNFQMSINPQLTKQYAVGNLEEMNRLLIKSSKFSFFILLLITLPLIFEAPLVLDIWLGEVPAHTVSFLRLILISSLLNTLANPLVASIQATGKIKNFQIIEGSLLMTIVPISYLLLKFAGVPPEMVFVVHICVEIITQSVRLKLVLPQINLPIIVYFRKVIYPIFLVVALAPIFPFIIYMNLRIGGLEVFIVIIISIVCCACSIFFVGCSESERIFIIGKSNQIFLKLKRKVYG